MKNKECKNCDYENYVRKGRAYLVCPNCGRDITLELVLMSELGLIDNNSAKAGE